MRCLVLDTDALTHGSGLGLLPAIEIVIASLPHKAYIARPVYKECTQTGIAHHLDGWQEKGLLHEPVDYRKLRGGDERFREIFRRYRGALSRADCASFVTAESNGPSGILTCENLLSEAAERFGILALDLFDVIRYAVKLGYLTDVAAKARCEVWDRDKFRAGRPNGYKGTYTEEFEFREKSKPIPDLASAKADPPRMPGHS